MSVQSTLPAAAPLPSHLVQLYDQPDVLRSAVASWLAPAVANGGAAVLVATPEHGALVLDGLRAGGLDTEALQREGRLLVLDADATMARFLVDGQPDAARFSALLGDVIMRLQAACVGPGTEVRAWGEMVNLLWQRGNLPAAQRLEDLWNEVIDRHGIRLLCSYHVGPPRPPEYVQLLKDLTRGHAAMLPREDQQRFDERVFQALAKSFGREEAEALWSLLLARQSAAIALPPAEAVLAAIHEIVPDLGARLLGAARGEGTAD